MTADLPASAAPGDAAHALATAETFAVQGKAVHALVVISEGLVPALLQTLRAVAEDADDPSGQLVNLGSLVLQWRLRAEVILQACEQPETMAINRAYGFMPRINAAPLQALREILEAWAARIQTLPPGRPPAADVFGQSIMAAALACTLSPPPVSAAEETAALHALRQDSAPRPPAGEIEPVIVTGSDGRRRLYLVDCHGQGTRV
ncbi:MAG: hypothetical protein HYY95_27615 [Candidatus Rokubacteria bacterium]|nr:hypothetical protein [Candidatus Rokubacteria bacterium]MBI3109297.1 hypothetical protein [Candidatus Rokubacteria bacterium]